MKADYFPLNIKAAIPLNRQRNPGNLSQFANNDFVGDPLDFQHSFSCKNKHDRRLQIFLGKERAAKSTEETKRLIV